MCFFYVRGWSFPYTHACAHIVQEEEEEEEEALEEEEEAPVELWCAHNAHIKLVLFRSSSLAVRSTCPPIMFTKDMYRALCQRSKIATRRIAGARWLRAHTRAFAYKQAVRVWSRAPTDKGSLYGNLVGHLFYTHIFKQRLDAMTATDVMLEGFPGWTVAEFHAAKFPGVALDTSVHVLLFVFFPLL
jgi:hypothetical protein